jgi:hypothetical protein
LAREGRENDVLTLQELSVIGMNALTGMGAKAVKDLPGGVLRYSSGPDGETAGLRLLDLAEVMEPQIERAVHIHGDVIAGSKIITGDKNIVAVEMEFSGIFSVLGKGSVEGVHAFIGCFFSEIRSIICKNKGASKTLGHTTTGALAALAAWVVESFHVGSHIATAVAAGVLVTVTTASKSAFCQMTAAQAAQTFPKPVAKTKSAAKRKKKLSKKTQ